MDVAYAADESYPKDQWCITEDVGRMNFYRTSQRPRSTNSVSELLPPSVALVSIVGISYQKTIMTEPQTRNSCHIDRRAGQYGSRAEVTVLAPGFNKFVAERSRRQLLKCKRTINLSTSNVRTLKSIKQMSELIAIALKYHIDVINVQEHRFYHEDIYLKYHELGNGWTFISAGSFEEHRGNSTIGGVGMLLSPHAAKSLKSIEKITSRILVATFHDNPEPTLISCFSPTNIADEQEVIDLYDDLLSVTRSVPKYNVLIIDIDLNAQIGQSMHHKFTYHYTSNRNGEYIEHFLIENVLLCINTQFQKRRGKLWTYTYPNGDRAQLDYMMINKKWINSVQNCEAYHSLERISRDHRIVSLRIKPSLRPNKKKSNTIAYNWEHLINNEDLQNQFSTSLRNRYKILQHEDTNESANNAYQNFVKTHKETAEMLIPQKEKVKRKVPWENDIIIEKRK